MDHQAFGTLMYWVLLAGLSLIAIGPAALHVYHGVQRRRRARPDSLDETWRTVIRDRA